MPPCCASAMARRDSVTVSMAALTMGMFRLMLRVTRVRVSTCVGRTADLPGTSSTSSKVRPSGIGPSNMRPPYRFALEKLMSHSNSHRITASRNWRWVICDG